MFYNTIHHKIQSLLLIIFCAILSQTAISQTQPSVSMTTDSLPYYSIPEPTHDFTATSVAARLIDGLGFRYRWATEELREEDLQYKPDSTARTAFQTMEHIHGMSRTILNCVKNEPNVRSTEEVTHTYESLRVATLNNIKTASDLLWADEHGDLGDRNIIYQRGETTSEYPFWNIINGQISDCLWHCGQIVSFRRASGNPIDPRVSVFRGALRK